MLNHQSGLSAPATSSPLPTPVPHGGPSRGMAEPKAWYLAGPMTGIAQFNFPLFHEAAAALRGKGYYIISPAELDSPAVQNAALASTTGTLDANGKIAGETWGQILARDVQIVADKCSGIVFLPDWSKSRGARLEAFVGLLCGHTFQAYAPQAPSLIVPLSPDNVRAGIMGAK